MRVFTAARRAVRPGPGPAEEKRRALDMIMLKNTGRGGWEFDEKMVSATAVFRLEVEEISCKEHE